MSSSLIDMGAVLDIAPLRSLVAVGDCGGFQRAATHLHLSQGAVSQHVRRLQAAVRPPPRRRPRPRPPLPPGGGEPPGPGPPPPGPPPQAPPRLPRGGREAPP